MDSRAPPTFWIIGGANGVGKTTFARARVTSITGSARFVNLDLIAHGLSPLQPGGEQARAARVALEMARDLIASRTTFAIESTLSGRTHLRLIDEARRSGLQVRLLYFFVSDIEETLRRIAQRVREGGHDVPEADVRRRWPRTLANFSLYAARSDGWQVFDANGRTPLLVAAGEQGRTIEVTEAVLPDPIARYVSTAV